MIRDEFDFINKITPKTIFQPALIKGIGDDAAVFEGSSTFDELICMDTMVEEVHFARKTMTPWMIGYKALAVNISDIAAMGGIPTFYLVSIAIPSDWSEEEVKQVYAGMTYLGDKFSMDLIGGDTVSSRRGLIITVTVCGKVEKGKSLLRSTAKEGDVVFVVGQLGGSAAGLELLLQNGMNDHYTDTEKMLIQAHQLPDAQIEAGRIFATCGETITLNDISDGLASEANEIAEASKVNLLIDYAKIPKNSYIKDYPIEKQKQWSLFGGEDYLLVGTTARQIFEKINQSCKQKGISLTCIGEVTSGKGEVFLVHGNKTEKLAKKGFNHFK